MRHLETLLPVQCKGLGIITPNFIELGVLTNLNGALFNTKGPGLIRELGTLVSIWLLILLNHLPTPVLKNLLIYILVVIVILVLILVRVIPHQ